MCTLTWLAAVMGKEKNTGCASSAGELVILPPVPTWTEMRSVPGRVLSESKSLYTLRREGGGGREGEGEGGRKGEGGREGERGGREGEGREGGREEGGRGGRGREGGGRGREAGGSRERGLDRKVVGEYTIWQTTTWFSSLSAIHYNCQPN